MVEKKVTAVIFEGGNPSSQIEQDMVKLRHAMVKDNIDRFRQVEAIDKIILATNYPLLRDEVADDVIVDFNDGDFHFGQRLKQIINDYQLHAVFYLGGAAGPLLSVEEIGLFAKQILEEPGTVLTNNVQSSDLVVFSPASAINSLVELPTEDNPLANMLRNIGLQKVLMPHSTGIHFDVDTPTDMLVLSINPAVGDYTRKVFKEIKYNANHLLEAKSYLALPYTDVLLSGRVGSPVITQINTYIRCRLRVFSEERGMKSLGREQQGLVESMVGHLFAILGGREFFNYLNRIVHVAFIDSRVLFAHNKLNLSDNDRYYADLLVPEKIDNDWTRHFTQAVIDSPVPVVVGGHSLVAGGMWSLIDTLLYEREQRYSENKLYRLTVPKHLEDCQYGKIVNILPAEAKVYGVTRAAFENQRAFTYIKPDLKLQVAREWHLHLSAPIEIVKSLENKGWELL